MTAPHRWVQIICGPRPPAERWKLMRAASAGASKPWQQVQRQAPVGRWRSEKPRSSVPPEVMIAAKRVGGLEAAVAALAAVGTVDGPEVQVLESFQKARRTQERPINALLSQTEASVERARKRVSRPTMSHANNSCKSWKRAKVDSLGCKKLLGHRKRQFNLHKRFDSDAGPIFTTKWWQIARGELVEELHGPVEQPRGQAARVPVVCSRGCPAHADVDSSRFKQLDFGRHSDLQEAMSAGDISKCWN